MVITRVARAPALAVALAVAVLGASACTGSAEDQAEVFDARELPADLCAAIPPQDVERWDLTELEHDTSGDAQGVEASCAMEGSAGDGSLTLDLRIRTFAGETERLALDAAEASMDESCGRLEAAGTGDFADGDYECSAAQRGNGPDGGATRLVRIRESLTLAGVVTGELVYDGSRREVPALEARLSMLVNGLSLAEPDEMVEPAS